MLSTLNLRAFPWALVAAVIAASRNLNELDVTLVAYHFGTIFAAFGILYRYTVWMQPPPTLLLAA